MAELQDVLPPGWDCKYDPKTGRHYFVNHHTKTTSWEDPRYRNRQLYGTPSHHPSMASEHIPLQHGSPDLRRNHVYPQYQTCPQPAFQMSSHYSPKNIPFQDLSRGSPLSVRAARIQDTSLSIALDEQLVARINSLFPTVTESHIRHLVKKYHGREAVIISTLQVEDHSGSSSSQDTSLSAPPDPEQSVAKIGTMFPTVSDTHIRLLLKKYHGREAVVISALQVEKHPITTPGPFTTPPPLRNLHTPFQMTPPLGLKHSSRGGSPILRPGSASPLIGEGAYHRPHSSPKMKLRYMKSLFPQAEETIILDILGNNDNNINKASEALKSMGFEKKTDKSTKKIETPKKEDQNLIEHTPPVRKLKSLQEKKQMKQKLHDKYKDIEEHVISLALESSEYDDVKAIQILNFMVQEQEQEENKRNNQAQEDQNNGEDENDTVNNSELKTPSVVPSSQSRQSLKVEIIENTKCRRAKDKKYKINDSISTDSMGDYKSSYVSTPNGPNSGLVQGSNDNLLLDDYVTWHGANPTIRHGPKGLAKGPNKSLLIPRVYQARGPNPELKKGPSCGLAKGSIFTQLKSVVVGESRGK